METTWRNMYLTMLVVLIVPCGMETFFGSYSGHSVTVLIVPCGMETERQGWHITDTRVLIVPCGMETTLRSIQA